VTGARVVDLLAVTRALVARGFSVIPLDHPDATWVTDPPMIGKTPAVKWKRYQTARPTDAELVAWFGNGRPRNVALVTGAVSNLVVVDGDSAEGLAWMQAHLPPTPMRTKTAKGEHWSYRHPGVRVKNKGRIKTGDPRVQIDIRGDGGYVVTVGSLHRTRVRYEPLTEWPPTSELPVFDPAWVDAPTRTDDIIGLLVAHYPPDGERWKFYEALAGFLLGTLRLTTTEALGILNGVVDGAQDTDTHPRPDYWVERTAARLAQGEECTGAPTVAEAIGVHGPAVVAQLRAWCGLAGTDAVVMRDGQLTAIVDTAEAALLALGLVYQRGGLLTRVVRLDAAVGDPHDVRRAAGSTMLAAVREPWLVEQMGRALAWRKVSAKGVTAPADPAPLYARTLLGRGEWRFPVLRGVVTAPTLARDGRIIEAPGFDAASGLLLDFAAGTFPPVPPAPTQDDARAALARLAHPLRGFPFESDAARSVALSALLTALIRVTLRTAPLHSFDAPQAGTGKSLLAETAGLLATGVTPPALSQGKSPEEDEKRLSTVLFAGDPVIHVDNVERPLQGDFLCSMLTQEVVQARILGLSERRILPCTALVVASGNNLVHSGDASRRAIVCRLDAQVERPDERRFDFDCHTEVRAGRPGLVVDGLTVLKAYHDAGRPGALTPMGSFDDWAWVRGALVWLGCADPADARADLDGGDPKKDELVGVMDLWAAALGPEPVDVGAVGALTSVAGFALVTRLTEIAGRSGRWNGRSVGWWLRRHKDRVVGGRAFRSEASGGHQRWWLAGAEPPAPQKEEAPF
jgi:hypothetical protein